MSVQRTARALQGEVVRGGAVGGERDAGLLRLGLGADARGSLRR